VLCVDGGVGRGRGGARHLEALPLHRGDLGPHLEARLVRERLLGPELARGDGRLGERLDLLRRHYGADTVQLSDASRPSEAARALLAYFDGAIEAVGDLPTATNGTAFQCAVWLALRRIPAGRTVSYGTLAARIGQPRASRAVGLANGSNPIAIVVPCHRVIASDGSFSPASPNDDEEGRARNRRVEIVVLDASSGQTL